MASLPADEAGAGRGQVTDRREGRSHAVAAPPSSQPQPHPGSGGGWEGEADGRHHGQRARRRRGIARPRRCRRTASHPRAHARGRAGGARRQQREQQTSCPKSVVRPRRGRRTASPPPSAREGAGGRGPPTATRTTDELPRKRRSTAQGSPHGITTPERTRGGGRAGPADSNASNRRVAPKASFDRAGVAARHHHPRAHARGRAGGARRQQREQQTSCPKSVVRPRRGRRKAPSEMGVMGGFAPQKLGRGRWTSPPPSARSGIGALGYGKRGLSSELGTPNLTGANINRHATSLPAPEKQRKALAIRLLGDAAEMPRQAIGTERIRSVSAACAWSHAPRPPLGRPLVRP